MRFVRATPLRQPVGPEPSRRKRNEVSMIRRAIHPFISEEYVCRARVRKPPSAFLPIDMPWEWSLVQNKGGPSKPSSVPESVLGFLQLHPQRH